MQVGLCDLDLIVIRSRLMFEEERNPWLVV